MSGSPRNGRIILMHRYTRDQIRRMPATLFVFGDNFRRVGYGGQAREARGEPNSVGIVTKLSPQAYLSDDDSETVCKPIVDAFTRLYLHLANGRDIVWPVDGVGTGLADLENQAPSIFQGIEICRERLFESASSIVVI